MRDDTTKTTNKSNIPKFKKGSVSDVATTMRRAEPSVENGLRPITFFVGAGCSVSSGVPTGNMIAQEQIIKLAKLYSLGEFSNGNEALKKLVDEGHCEEVLYNKGNINWGQVYDWLFQEAWSSPDDARQIFKDIIRNHQPKINWAHLALGELAAQKWISTTISTNFDLLALEGYARAGVIPVVSDGIESLDRIEPNPDYPQLLQINGSIHTYRLRNRPEELDDLSQNSAANACFQSLYKGSRAMVIIGYEGREPQIMKLLRDAAKTFPDKHVFWCMHSADSEKLSENARVFLEHNKNARLLTGQDADQFFLKLCQTLGVGAPKSVSDPLFYLRDLADKIYAPEDSTITENVKNEIAHLKKTIEKIETCLLGVEDENDIENTLSKIREADLKGNRRAIVDVSDNWLDKNLASANQEELAEVSRRKAIALYKLGQRAAGETALNYFKDAVDANDFILKIIARETVPIKWAKVQTNRAVVLGNIGERSSGKEALEYLQEAIEAFDLALEILTRDTMPEDWALTQMNRANTLLALAERSIGEEALKNLQDAIQGYDLALEIRTRETVPADWAMTHMNRANALLRLGERSSGEGAIKYLNDAIKAHDLVLEVKMRSTMPADWALTQMNRASALAMLGERTSGDEALIYLQEAIQGYDLALEIYSELGMDYDLKLTQNNRAIAVSTLEKKRKEMNS